MKPATPYYKIRLWSARPTISQPRNSPTLPLGLYTGAPQLYAAIKRIMPLANLNRWKVMQTTKIHKSRNVDKIT